MNLERIALMRAEEQMHAETWRKADRGEFRVSVKETACLVCHTVFTKFSGRNAMMCPECRAAGWSTVPCKGCGGRLRQLDRRAVKSRRGYCQTCRAAMPQVQRGAETIAHARAVRMERLAARGSEA